MLERIKRTWSKFWKSTYHLFVRDISHSKTVKQKESSWEALKEFLTRYPRYILALFLVAIAPFVLAGIVFLILTITKPSLTVPQLEGLSILDASSIIQEKDMSISIIPELSSRYPQNYIIHQDIPAGRKIKEGRNLLLYVSTGASHLDFPSFIGKNFYDVKIGLEHASPTMKTVQIQNVLWEDSPKPFGEILSQSPQTGSYRDFPIAVNFVVSNGSSQTLPSFVGQYSLSAAYALDSLGLLPQFIFEKTSDPKMDGRVLRQNPAGNTIFNPKMKVQLVVGQYNQDIKYFRYTIPSDLDGKTVGLLLNDNRGQKILFLGFVKSGDTIETATPVYGTWTARIYIYDANNNKTLYRDLNA